MEIPMSEGTTVLLLDGNGACVATFRVERAETMIATVSIDTELQCHLIHQTVDPGSVTRVHTKRSE